MPLKGIFYINSTNASQLQKYHTVPVTGNSTYINAKISTECYWKEESTQILLRGYSMMSRSYFFFKITYYRMLHKRYAKFPRIPSGCQDLLREGCFLHLPLPLPICYCARNCAKNSRSICRKMSLKSKCQNVHWTLLKDTPSSHVSRPHDSCLVHYGLLALQQR